MLPPTMRAGGQVYTPYSCLAFDIRADGTAATDIEHIVALADAHDSGIADVRRRDIAADLDNLTIADPRVNRTEKSDRDAGEWTPARHGAWFAERIIAITVAFSEPLTGFELEDLVVGHGSAAELQGNNASYMATITPAASGTRDGGHRGRGPAGRGRQPERGGGPVLDRRGPDAGAGSAGDRRARACAAVAGAPEARAAPPNLENS